MRTHAPLLAAALFALPALPAAAQSFNCNYARLPAEIAICEYGDLALADEEMATAYFRLTNQAPGWAVRQIKNEQQEWLVDRNACGYDAQCILDAYNWRLRQLDDWGYQLGL